MSIFIRDQGGHYFNLDSIDHFNIYECSNNGSNIYNVVAITVKNATIIIKSYTNLSDAENYLSDIMKGNSIN
jgi:hypothetical protein